MIKSKKVKCCKFKRLLSKSLLILPVIFLFSCTSPEYSAALTHYNNAKLNHSLSSQIDALKILAKLDPDKHINELSKNVKLAEILNTAKVLMASGNYYQAYIHSHDVYRQSLDNESKKLLVASGKKLSSILKAQNNIESYFNDHPKGLSETLTKLARSTVISWNLIDVNQLVSQLSKDKLILQSALAPLGHNNYSLYFPEIKQWSKGIKEQLTKVTIIQDFIINRARHQSAIALLDTHKVLAKDSIELLSYVNEKLAIDTLIPTFSKAAIAYQPYQVLIENLSLALLLNRADIHSSWYINWRELEIKILHPKDPFSNYVKEAKDIDAQLNKLISQNTLSLPSLNSEFDTLAEFTQQHPQVNALIKRLKRDKTLI